MALSQESILEKLNKPANRGQIDLAVLHEEKVRFCTKKHFDSTKPSYLNTHLAKVKAKLPEDKYNNYASELSFPLPINSVADVIFSHLYKVWDTDSRTIEGNFSRPGFKQDLEDFLQETNFLRFFQKDGWEAYKTQPNCILTIDMPTEQEGYYPSPYINIVDISSLVEQPRLSKTGDILELLYYVNDLRVVGIDRDNYYVVTRTEVGKDWIFEGQSPHGLYWCPATFLIQDSLDSNNKLLKESAVTKVLYDFEKLLFRIISGENLEDYAGYPVTVMQDTDCDYEDGQGNKCQGGVIALPESVGHYACPSCGGSKLNGAGTVYGVRAGDDGKYDLDGAVKIISADVTTLDYKDKSIETRKQTIIAACSGASSTALSGQAQNEKQIASIFESQAMLIQKVQDNLEAAIKFCLDTIGTMRYGEVYTGSVVNLGTQHFLLTDTEIQDSIDKAVTAGAPQYHIGELYSEYAHTKFKANPRMQERMSILKRLEPFPYFSNEDALTYLSGNEILFYLKYNFVTLVAKFEDENGDIVDFGSLLPVKTKIDTIQQTLIQYVKDEISQFGGITLRQSGQQTGVLN